MTQEEKAKRYDEALEELRGLLEGIREEKCKILEEDITSIFPELQENEDERIRGALLNTVKYYHFKESPYMFGISKEQTIAWLEKQGNHANFRNKIQIGDKVTRNENGVLVNLSQLKRVAKEYNITGIGSKNAQGKLGEMIKRKLEMDKQSDKSQGKSALEAINEEKVDNANKVEPKDYSSIDPHFWKSIDKVKPKFHEGQWIVWQGKYFKVNYNGCGYELTDQNGKSTSLEYGAIDETANLWRIQDAKPGDVLYSPKNSVVERIVLIGGWKRLDGDSSLCAAITYRVKENEVEVEYPGAIWWSGKINSFYPATKEQRDVLEKAMADAGYTFDFEKKELKKIEDEIEIPYGTKDSELIEESYYIPKGFHAEIEGDKVVIKKGEKSTVWSEDDETALGDALWAIEQAKTVAKNENDMGNIWHAEKWLKSLKGRMHPKNDYNPYKEVVESIAKMCERYDKYSYSILKDFFNNVKVKCKDAKEFDSLHSQNTKVLK